MDSPEGARSAGPVRGEFLPGGVARAEVSPSGVARAEVSPGGAARAGVLPAGVLPQLDTFSSAIERYSDWGWLVLRSENRLLLTTDHAVSAVELGAGIGGEVQHYLSVRLLGGPVVVLPGAPSRWLILTSSADEASQVNLIRLRARGALTHRLGTLVPLPPSRIDRGGVGTVKRSV